MDIMTLVYILKVPLLLYLFHGVKLSCKGIFKLVLAFQLMFDIILGDYWQNVTTYQFIKLMTPQNEVNALITLWFFFFAFDLAEYLLARRKLSENRKLKGSEIFTPLANLELKSFAIACLFVGLILKLTEWAVSGILFGRDPSTYKPEDTVGVYVLLSSNFFIPFALALMYRNRLSQHGKIFSRFPLPEVILMFAISFLSFSKAGVVNYIFVYVVTLSLSLGFGTVKRAFLKPILIPALIIVVIFFGIKTQQRSNTAVEYDSGTLVQSALSGVGGRFSGIYRSFVAICVSINEYKAETMGGYYHLQTFYLWIPRFLWEDKPRIAGEKLFDYLDVYEESYGTSFAVNMFGAALVDFGFPIAMLFILVVGFAFVLIDTLVERLISMEVVSNQGIYFSSLWICSAIYFAESGIPSAITQTMSLTVFYFVTINIDKLVIKAGISSQKVGV